MKKLPVAILFVILSVNVFGQFVAIMEVKEPIDGLCNQNKVYALFPMLKGQYEAECPVSKDEILKRLNTEVQFLKENPKFRGKGMIGVIVNCKGLLVQVKMSNKTKSEELDKQMMAVFESLKEWKPGRLEGTKVDSSQLFSFKIKKGVVTWD